MAFREVEPEKKWSTVKLNLLSVFSGHVNVDVDFKHLHHRRLGTIRINNRQCRSAEADERSRVGASERIAKLRSKASADLI